MRSIEPKACFISIRYDSAHDNAGMASWFGGSSDEFSGAQFGGKQRWVVEYAQRCQAAVAIENDEPPCCTWDDDEELCRAEPMVVDVYSDADDLVALTHDESRQRRSLVGDFAVARVLAIEIQIGYREFFARHG